MSATRASVFAALGCQRERPALWRLTLAGLLVLLAVGGCQRDAPKRQRLTLYCSAQDTWCDRVAVAFEADSGVKVSMIRKSSGEAYAQLWAERRNPRGDVWWGGTGDAHIQAAEAKLTEPYRSPRVDELHPWAVDPAGEGEHRTTGVYMGVLGLGYNTEWLAKKGIAPPVAWKDLLDPAFRGEVQVANPASSGTAYTLLATWVQLFGEDDAFDYLGRLHQNVNQYTKSGAAPIRAAARGETGVAIVFLHDVATQQKAGFPVRLVVPEEGTGYEVGCVSIIRGARHPGPARAFVDWALSPGAQALGDEVDAFQIPSHREAPIPKDAPRPEGMRVIDFDSGRFGKKAERTRLLGRWEREVKSLPR